MFDLGMSGEIGSVFFQKCIQIVDGIIGEMGKFFAQLLHLFEDRGQFFLVFLDVESCDPAHGEGKKFFHILISHIPPELLSEGGDAGMDFSKSQFVCLALFDTLVDPVFKEDLRQSFGMEKFCLAFQGDLQFPFKVVEKFFGVAVKNFADGHDARAAVPDHGQIDRNGF